MRGSHPCAEGDARVDSGRSRERGRVSETGAELLGGGGGAGAEEREW